DRVENNPAPVGLQTPCDPAQVEQLIAGRLKYLYDTMGVPFRADQPTFPLPESLVRELVGMRARDVLGKVHLYRESCVTKGKMADYPFDRPPSRPTPPGTKVTTIEQAWNEQRTMSTFVVPVDEADLAEILAEAVLSCSGELTGGDLYEAAAAGRFVPI